MSLQVKRENMPEKKVVLKTGEGEGSMIIRQAYGNESSLLVALRPPGYHTGRTCMRRSKSTMCSKAKSGSSSKTKVITARKGIFTASRRIVFTGRGTVPTPSPR